MGIFYVDCIIENIKFSEKSILLKKLLVDTGAEYSWIPESDLKKILTKPTKKDIPFVMANGQLVTREVGYAILKVDKFETVDEVVFAKPGDMKLLGARTIEGFAAVIDARKKKLVAAGPLPVAIS